MVDLLNEVLKENFDYVPLYKTINIADELIKRGVVLKENFSCEESISSKFGFSKKQQQVLTWWCKENENNNKNGIICDGAIRAGKTLCMSLSFIGWAFSAFNNTSFAICGKTIAALKRNIVVPLIPILTSLDFEVEEKNDENFLIIRKENVENRFYLFGGQDESSG